MKTITKSEFLPINAFNIVVGFLGILHFMHWFFISAMAYIFSILIKRQIFFLAIIISILNFDI